MRKSRKLIIRILSCLVCCCLLAGASTIGNVFAAEPDPSGITMLLGASVRINEEDTGIRFFADVSKAQVEAWEEDNTLRFGMLIMPQDYLTTVGELTESNVFGNSSIFCCDEEAEGKTRIINLVTRRENLKEDPEDSSYYQIKGSIIGIKEANLQRKFVARAYAELTSKADDTVSYIMADYANGNVENNKRSILEICDKAYDDHIKNSTCPVGVTNTTYTAFLKGTMSTVVNKRVNAYIADTSDSNLAKVSALLNGLSENSYNAVLQNESVVNLNNATRNKYLTELEESYYVISPNPSSTIDFGGDNAWTNGLDLQGVATGATTVNAGTNDGMFSVYLKADGTVAALGIDTTTQTGCTKRFGLTSDDGDYAIFLPKINYAENNTTTVTFDMFGGNTTITNLSFERGKASAVSGYGTIGASFVYADGTLTCTLTKGLNTETFTTTDSGILNGTKSIVLFATKTGANTSLHMGNMTVSGESFVKETVKLDALYDGIIGKLLLENSETTLAKNTNYLQTSNLKPDTEMKLRFAVEAGNMAFYLPRINFVRNPDVTLYAFNSGSNTLDLGLSREGNTVSGGWGAFELDFDFDENTGLTVTVTCGTNSETYTITDNDVIFGNESVVLYVNSSVKTGSIHFGTINSTRRPSSFEVTLGTMFALPGEAPIEP